MEEIEVSARTVDEAVEKALEQLGLSEEEVEITIVKKGRSGLLGLGAQDARILVRPLLQDAKEEEGETILDRQDDRTIASLPSESVMVVKGVLEKLLVLMGVNAQVEVVNTPTTNEDASVTLNIVGNDLGILIGRRGQTLASLQHLVRVIAARHFREQVPIVIDVESYKQRRYQTLGVLATRLAQKVNTTGRSITLEPMPASERRLIHISLRDNPLVTTQSVGEGDSRKVIILPKRH